MKTELSFEEYKKMKEAMDNAENSDRPYAVVEDDQIHVVGDVNDTEKITHDYTIQFAYPNNESWREYASKWKKIGESKNYYGVEKEFKDIFIPPMIQTQALSTFAELYSFFYKVTEDGSVKALTLDEARVALRDLNQEMTEAMCHAVASILGIEREEEKFMLPFPSVIRTFIRMCDDFPELINGVDFFTEQLPGEKENE